MRRQLIITLTERNIKKHKNLIPSFDHPNDPNKEIWKKCGSISTIVKESKVFKNGGNWRKLVNYLGTWEIYSTFRFCGKKADLIAWEQANAGKSYKLVDTRKQSFDKWLKELHDRLP